MTTTWEIENDYEIRISDVLNGVYTGEYISLSDDGYCGVRFDGVGSPDLREFTYEVSGGDGIQFGTEHYGAVNWTITGSIHASNNVNTAGSSEVAWNNWSKLYRAWTDYPGRLQSRAVVPLYFKRPGRGEMVVFGRPRRIDPDTSNSHAGYIAYTALFMQSDPKFYSSDEKLVTTPMTATVMGGLLYNGQETGLLQPFQTTPPIVRPGNVTNDGDTNASARIRVTGPILNPTITLHDGDGDVVWVAQLLIDLPDGKWVDIDARHQVRAIVNEDGISYAGFYRGVRLQELAIPPGTYNLTFTGADLEGTSTCDIYFRDAWAST